MPRRSPPVSEVVGAIEAGAAVVSDVVGAIADVRGTESALARARWAGRHAAAQEIRDTVRARMRIAMEGTDGGPARQLRAVLGAIEAILAEPAP